MFRFAINRLICLSSSRSLLSNTTDSIRQNVIQSGIKSVSACNIQPFDQTRPISYGNEHSSRTFNTRMITFKSMRHIQTLADADSSETKDNLLKDSPSQTNVKEHFHILEKKFSLFEQKCLHNERVYGGSFAEMFDTITKCVERCGGVDELEPRFKSSLSEISSFLLRSCGRLMDDTSEKDREMLAANLWQFINEKRIPVTITHYNNLILALNENATTFDPQKMLDEMINVDIKPDRITYQRLIHQYCLQGNITGATNLLEKMKALNMELHEPVFASLIIGYGKQENAPSIDEIFDLMRSNGIEPAAKSCVAAIVSQAKLLEKNPAAEQELKKIRDFVERENIKYGPNDVVDLIYNLHSLKNNTTVAEIYNGACELFSGPGNMNYRYRMFCALFSVGDCNKAAEIYWSINPPLKAIASGNLGQYYIQLMALHKHTPIEHIFSECEKLKEKKYNTRPYYHLYYFAVRYGNQVLIRETIDKLCEEMGPQIQFYWPLIAQAKGEKELLDVLKDQLYPAMSKFGPDDIEDTFAMWVWPRLGDHVSVFKINKELNNPISNNLLVRSFLAYAVRSQGVEEAVKFTTNMLPGLIESIDGQKEENANDQRLNKNRMFEVLLRKAADETRDPVVVKNLFDLCKSLCSQVSARLCVPLVRVHLENGDHVKALETFFTIAEEFRVTPCKSELVEYCLDKKDSQTLQNIMDVSTRLHGENNSLFDLATSCIRSGRFKQAQKVLSSPGLRVDPRRVISQAYSFVEEKDITLLEHYVRFCRNLGDVDQEVLYRMLIKAYETKSCPERALDLWNRMQDEEFQPSRAILQMIAKLLEKNKIEVPFRQFRKLSESEDH